jgi:hypothetical protein
VDPRHLVLAPQDIGEIRRRRQAQRLERDLSSQCLDRRIPDKPTLIDEIALDRAFAAILREKPDALITFTDSLTLAVHPILQGDWLAKLGWIEGHNVRFDRFSSEDPDRLRVLAGELVRLLNLKSAWRPAR